MNTAKQHKGQNEDEYTLYDAIPESKVSTKEPTSPVDHEMDKFLPMLQEYLRSMIISLCGVILTILNNMMLVNNEPSNIASTSDKDGEYVWDVFYHRPAITGIVAVANVATMCVSYSFTSWRGDTSRTILDPASLPLQDSTIQNQTKTLLVMRTTRTRIVRTMLRCPVRCATVSLTFFIKRKTFIAMTTQTKIRTRRVKTVRVRTLTFSAPEHGNNHTEFRIRGGISGIIRGRG